MAINIKITDQKRSRAPRGTRSSGGPFGVLQDTFLAPVGPCGPYLYPPARLYKAYTGSRL